MKLKTLLLGSAASLMAATSSFAADAVVAEPEAVEYVRVCDAYGTGYFYIPGTERCLKLSGEVRFQYDIVNSDAGTVDDVDADWAYRARFAVNSANESDFGTIRTYMRFEANYNDPGVTTAITAGGVPIGQRQRDLFLQAMTLSIGGFEVGIFDNYWTKNNGYGNLFAMADGYYGYSQAIYAQYTYEVAGFAVTAGVEQLTNDNAAGTPNFSGDQLNLYAGASYGGSWGSAAATLYYDNHFSNDIDYKVSLLLKPIQGLQVKGWYLGGDGIYTLNAGGVGADYAYGVSAAYTFGDFSPYIGYTDTDGVAPAYVAVGAVYAPSSADGLKVQVEGQFFTEGVVTAANPNTKPKAYRVRLIKEF